MLLHLIPKILNNYPNSVELASFSIPEFNFQLSSEELVLRKPYPNKRYLVACLRKGKKAIKGILITTPEHVSNFSAITTWLIQDVGEIKHIVNYTILDREHNVISDDHTLLYASKSDVFGHYEARSDFHLPPVCTQPYMEVFKEPASSKKENMDVHDICSTTGLLIKRVENINIKTIEKDRYLRHSNYDGRFPNIEDTFII